MKYGFKFCFSTLPCQQCSVEELKELCEKYGMDGVELRLLEDHVPEITNGLNVVDICPSIQLFGYDEETLARAKGLIDEIEGTPIRGMRIFLGNFIRTQMDPKQRICYEGIVKALQELCDYTQKEMWVETHNEFSTGEVLNMLIADVGRDNLKIIWDVIHTAEFHESPEQTWEYIGDRIAHVHIKDGYKSENPLAHDFIHTPLGKGELPLRHIFRMLDEKQYRGYVSLEWENLWRTELADCSDNIGDILGMWQSYILEG